jgi:hypothetical protein
MSESREIDLSSQKHELVITNRIAPLFAPEILMSCQLLRNQRQNSDARYYHSR